MLLTSLTNCLSFFLAAAAFGLLDLEVLFRWDLPLFNKLFALLVGFEGLPMSLQSGLALSVTPC